MTCQELADFLARYLDQELPNTQRSEFDRHLRECPPCEVYLGTYRATIALGRSAIEDPAAPVPQEVPEELVRAILAAKSRPR